MSDIAASLRFVNEPNAAKKIARLHNIAVITAKKWLTEGVPAHRHQEVARGILDEIAVIRAILNEIERSMKDLVDGTHTHIDGDGGSKVAGARGVKGSRVDRLLGALATRSLSLAQILARSGSS